MIIAIDQSSDVPLYLQIRAQIISGIAQGELASGDALPSVRSLASCLGVNLHTVNKAYAVLRDDGYITMQGRRGAVVKDFPRTASSGQVQSANEQLLKSLVQLAREYRARGGAPSEFISLATQAAMFDIPQK